MQDPVEGIAATKPRQSALCLTDNPPTSLCRFSGTDPEPRPGLSSGHMPHSVSLPFSVLLSEPSTTQPPYKTLLPREKLKSAILKALGGDEAKLQAMLAGKLSVVNSCGSGMTAAIIWLALQELGVKSAVYDEVGS